MNKKNYVIDNGKEGGDLDFFYYFDTEYLY